MTLTNQKIGRLSAVDGKRVSISVGDGLTIRVHPSGRKSWVFRRYRDGRVIDETIGYWPEMSLKHARQAVREKRKRAALEPPAGFTLRDAFRLWCAVKKKSISSYSEERRRIERHVMSVLGRRQIDEITAPLVIAHLKSLDGSKNGNDKSQFIFNNKTLYYRYDDASVGEESWDGSSWKKYDLTDLAQDSAVVHLEGTETISGTKFLSGSLYADSELIRRSSSDASRIVQQSTVLTKGEIPTVGKWYDFAAVDCKGLNQVNRAGSVSIGVYPTGDVRTYLRAYQWKSGSSTAAAIYVGITQAGDIYTYAPTPVSSSNDNSIATTSWVRANTVPTGTILPFAGTTVPTGFLLCNGALVSRTTYAALYAAIGTKWGAGDGSTTFKLPDLRKRHLEGANTASEVGGYLDAGLPNIIGTFFARNDDDAPTGAFSRTDGWTGGFQAGGYGRHDKYTFDASTANAAYGASSTVTPPSAKALYIIKS